jgi:hypothetical protein
MNKVDRIPRTGINVLNPHPDSEAAILTDFTKLQNLQSEYRNAIVAYSMDASMENETQLRRAKIKFNEAEQIVSEYSVEEHLVFLDELHTRSVVAQHREKEQLERILSLPLEQHLLYLQRLEKELAELRYDNQLNAIGLRDLIQKEEARILQIANQETE